MIFFTPLAIAWIALGIGMARLFGVVAYRGANDSDATAPTYGGLPR